MITLIQVLHYPMIDLNNKFWYAYSFIVIWDWARLIALIEWYHYKWSHTQLHFIFKKKFVEHSEQQPLFLGPKDGRCTQFWLVFVNGILDRKTDRWKDRKKDQKAVSWRKQLFGNKTFALSVHQIKLVLQPVQLVLMLFFTFFVTEHTLIFSNSI